MSFWLLSVLWKRQTCLIMCWCSHLEKIRLISPCMITNVHIFLQFVHSAESTNWSGRAHNKWLIQFSAIKRTYVLFAYFYIESTHKSSGQITDREIHRQLLTLTVSSLNTSFDFQSCVLNFDKYRWRCGKLFYRARNRGDTLGLSAFPPLQRASDFPHYYILQLL